MFKKTLPLTLSIVLSLAPNHLAAGRYSKKHNAAKQNSMNQQTMNQRLTNQNAMNQYSMNQRPTNNQQTMNQNSMNQYSMNQRPTNNQQTTNQNSMNQYSMNQNSMNQNSMNQRPTNNQQAMNQHSMNQYSMNQHPTNNQQTTNQNSMNQYSMNQHPTNNQQTTNQNNSINEQQCSLRCKMNKLWSDQVFWTREFIESSVAGLQDKDAVVQRLLHNQDEIGNAIAPFYGAEAGRELATLLRKHITIYADLVKAALMHNTDEVNNLYAQWQMNASELATFLSSANPYWNQQQMTDMFNEHLRLTATELQLRMNSDWAADIANFDEIFKQALMMAKNLADGIAQQFPANF